MNVRLHDAVYWDGKFLFAASNINGFFAYNIQDGTLQYKGSFNCHVYENRAEFGKQLIEGQRIFFIPYGLKQMVVYHLESGKFDYVPFGFENGLIYDAFIIEGYLWAVQQEYPGAILRMNIYTYEMMQYSVDWNAVQKECNKPNEPLEKDGFIYKGIKYVNGVLWMLPICKPGIIFAYHIGEKKTVVHKISGCENELFTALALKGQSVYAVVKGKPLVIELDLNFKVVDRLYYQGEEKEEIKEGQVKAVIVKESLIIIKMNEIYVIDLETHITSCYKFHGLGTRKNFELINDKLFIFTTDKRTSALSCLNIKTGILEERELVWNPEENTGALEKYFNKYAKEATLSLTEYLDMTGSDAYAGNVVKNKSAGRKIWDNVRNGSGLV